jgi:polysaccharide biosynthesis transport protein
MELSAYFRPLIRWWWLLVAATCVAAISTLLVLRQQPTLYQARTTLMIGQTINDPNPDSSQFYLAEQLASAYANMANRRPVQEATMEALGLSALPQYYARVIPQSQLIEIVVTDVNPLRAQVVSNELANQLIFLSPTGAESQSQVDIDFINQQIADIQSQILTARDEITRLQDQLGTINSAIELQDTQNQINAQQQKVLTLQGIYANLLLNTQRGSPNTLIVVEPADLPTRPIGAGKSMLVLLAAGIGFSLAAGAAYLLDYIDDTLKNPEDITRLTGLPVIGYIGETKNFDDANSKLYVARYPRSPGAESYRSLRANIKFLGVDTPLKTILVTSPNVNAGKSTVSANLAAVIAQGEEKVLLLDADLRRPRVHELIGISNSYGLTDIFKGRLKIDEVIHTLGEEKFSAIVSGQSPPNPAELLGSEKMKRILSQLREMFDYLIIDSPPFVVTDAIFLADRVDGVIIVLTPGQTRRKVLQTMLEQIKRADARILGVVLNRIPQTSLSYYGGSNYYSPYGSNGNYLEDEDMPQPKGRFGKLLLKVQTKTDELLNKSEG